MESPLELRLLASENHGASIVERRADAGSDEATVLISLVIATLNDSGDLVRCLESLCRQQEPPAFEIIIVDQNPTNALAATAAGFACRLRIIYKHTSFQGASRARNLGAMLARGSWLGFPDDDCELLPNALREVQSSAADPAVQVITGQTVDPDGLPNILRWRKEPFRYDRWTMFACLTEATLFVRSSSFFLAGGFDQRFGPGAPYPAAEGVELMNRLFKRMTPGQAFYNPAIQMRHPTKIPPWDRAAVLRYHSYAIGDGALIAKNPEMHILNWGMRTLVRAALHTASLDGWQSVAYLARVLGLLRGFLAYKFA
jgi:glycosyltransferase involved in cell wall biosynthesis